MPRPHLQRHIFVIAVTAMQNSTAHKSAENPLNSVPKKYRNDTVADSLPTVTAFTKHRRRRQAIGTRVFADFVQEHGSTLKGTAYEGQDKQFHRVEPVVSALNPQYEALARYQARQGLLGPGAQLPAQLNKNDGAGMYWPYRTMVGTADVQGAPQGMRMAPVPSNFGNGETLMPSSPSSATSAGGEPALMEPPAMAQNFFVPEKCDFGTDPQWCGDYVQQFVKWFEQYGSRGKPICLSLMESLKDSDHRCCNTLKKMNC